MQASILIPVYNDSKRLKLCLDALANQTVPTEEFEVIVVDNGSEEPPKDLVESYSFTQFQEESKPGSYAARNKGLEVAQGKILAFTDSDCIPEPNWLEEGIKAVSVDGFDGQAGGAIEIFPADSENPNHIELYDMIFGLNQKNYISQRHFAATANMFTLRKVVDEVGPFNSEVMSGGDNQWGTNLHALGRSVLFAPKAIIKHPARSDFDDMMTQTNRCIGGRHDYFVEKRKNQGLVWILKRVFFNLMPPFYAYYRSLRFLRKKNYGLKEILGVWKIVTVKYLNKNITFVKLFFTSKRERR